MKVSRKVGRRKHSRSSFVSRRRLRNKKSRSGYKKRYAKTQRGGARSRKYGDKRTHKRGKRFHRGGIDDKCYENLPSIADIPKLDSVELKYKKNVFGSMSESKPFNVEVYGYSGINEDDCQNRSSIGKIVLERQTSDKPVTITMQFRLLGISGEQAEFLSNGTAKEGDKDVKYSFNFPENSKFFKDVFYTIIKNNQKKRSEITEREKVARETLEETKRKQQERELAINGKLDTIMQDIKKETRAKINEMNENNNYTDLHVRFYKFDSNRNLTQESDEVDFNTFKQQQEQRAGEIKQSITESSLLQEEKDFKIEELKTILRKIIDEQKELMLATYIYSEVLTKGLEKDEIVNKDAYREKVFENLKETDVIRDTDRRRGLIKVNERSMEELVVGLTPASSAAVISHNE